MDRRFKLATWCESCSECIECEPQSTDRRFICPFCEMWSHSRSFLGFLKSRMFPKSRIFPTSFSMKYILLVTLILSDTNATNFSFTDILYYLLVDNQSKYDCFYSKRERGGRAGLTWAISCCSLLIQNRLFDLRAQNFQINFDGRITSNVIGTRPCIYKQPKYSEIQ